MEQLFPSNETVIHANRGARTIRYRRATASRLRSQSFEVFCMLAHAHPGPASKNDIIASVWCDKAVTDDSLVQSIGNIRKALQDTAHVIVQTLPNKGYRLTVPVAFDGAIDAHAPIHTQAPSASQAAMGPIAFQNLVEEVRHEVIAQGLSGDNMAHLVQSETFRTLSHLLAHTESTMARSEPFGGFGSRDAGDCGVPGEAHKRRLIAFLSDAQNGRGVWSGAAEELFESQDMFMTSIIGEVANNWSGVMADRETVRASESPPQELEAYELVQLGVSILRSFTPEAIVKSEEYFKAATDRAPLYGVAWASLSVVYGLMATAVGDEDPAKAKRARYDCGQRAIASAPQNSWSLLAGGWVAAVDDNVELAKDRVRMAVVKSPNDTDILAAAAAYAALNTDMHIEAESWALTAIGLHVTPPDWYHACLGLAQFCQGRDGAAIASFRKAPQNYAGILAFCAASLFRSGDKAKSAEQVARLRALYPGFSLHGYIASEAFSSEAKRHLITRAFINAELPT